MHVAGNVITEHWGVFSAALPSIAASHALSDHPECPIPADSEIYRPRGPALD